MKLPILTYIVFLVYVIPALAADSLYMIVIWPEFSGYRHSFLLGIISFLRIKNLFYITFCPGPYIFQYPA